MSLKKVKNPNIMELVKRKEYKRRLNDHETWGHVGGRAYSYTKIFYTILFIYTILITLAYLMSAVFVLNDVTSELENYNIDEINQMKNRLFIVIASLVLLIIAFVLQAIKKPIAFLVCNTVSTILLAFGFLSENLGFSKYLVRHGASLFLMLAAGVVLFVIHMIEKRNFDEAYNYYVSNLYREAARDKSFTEEQWQEYLNNYANDAQSDKSMKRSRKVRLSIQNETKSNGEEREDE